MEQDIDAHHGPIAKPSLGQDPSLDDRLSKQGFDVATFRRVSMVWSTEILSCEKLASPAVKRIFCSTFEFDSEI